MLGAFLAALVVFSSAAVADEYECSNTTLTGIINGDVYVPYGAACTLDDVEVNGNVFVKKGATLAVTNMSWISGNLDVYGAAALDVRDSWIKGSVTVRRSMGPLNGSRGLARQGARTLRSGSGTSQATPPAPNTIQGCSIEGNVYLFYNGDKRTNLAVEFVVAENFVGGNVREEGNFGTLAIFDNCVNGDVEFYGNGNAAFLIDHNRIKGNLTCQSNLPDPTGMDNQVCGNAEHQCMPIASHTEDCNWWALECPYPGRR